jgi:hypothetical protein
VWVDLTDKCPAPLEPFAPKLTCKAARCRFAAGAARSRRAVRARPRQTRRPSRAGVSEARPLRSLPSASRMSCEQSRPAPRPGVRDAGATAPPRAATDAAARAATDAAARGAAGRGARGLPRRTRRRASRRGGAQVGAAPGTAPASTPRLATRAGQRVRLAGRQWVGPPQAVMESARATRRRRGVAQPPRRAAVGTRRRRRGSERLQRRGSSAAAEGISGRPRRRRRRRRRRGLMPLRCRTGWRRSRAGRRRRLGRPRGEPTLRG